MSQVLEDFIEFQNQMMEKIASNPDVLGLMFAGSAAELSRVDQYSDQDFYLIVRDGMAESFRQDLFWLPAPHDIALRPRETEHGLKVLYQNGTMLEFAVFEIGELHTHLAPGDNRVAFDRGGVKEIIDIISYRQAKGFDPETEYQLFLTLLHIGIGRVKRGEIIAGSQHIKSYALNHLLGLIRHFQPAALNSSDELNRYRRFENDYPQLGSKLAALIEGESLMCARAMVDIADALPVSKKFELGRKLVLDALAP